MYRRIFVTLLVIMTIALAFTVTASAQEGKKAAGKATSAKLTAPHEFANMVAVCGCGKVFVPNANTKTFTYEGKEYACCSEECHNKLAGMPAAEAAKLCETQLKKLETPAETSAKK